MECREESISYRPIGVIRSPHVDPRRTPIQPRYAAGIAGSIEIFPEFSAGLDDLEGFSHIVLLYHFHRSHGSRLRVVPYLDDEERGVFATRAPHRPNAIRMSVVRLVRREGNILHIEDIDALDGTPVLDIKPHVPRFGVEGAVRSGWLESVDEATATRRGRRDP
ncbi:MAG: tRNA (N6-threonylcarbamoyladenosine(37)-N6)-methyltransferase TrmO [Candidatus Bipolaricaulota bacterium]|nr:MAG: tRNA (N6-threonylcarbamoyladenosine(37)-N6)-methyltransferase TrmO [Candidatus Bipolaricaulota bacterium]